MIAKPLTIWSERSVTENTAWMSPSSPPKSMAMNSPTTQEPLQTAPQMPKNAPASIIPSSPMFTTPARSESTPPMAANASGVAKRSIDANRPAVKMLSTVSASFVCTQTAASVPAMPIPIAHQPSRVSPRGTAAMPQAIAIMPAAIGAPTDPKLQGGSATQSATRPATIADPGDRARRRQAPDDVGDGVHAGLVGAHSPTSAPGFAPRRRPKPRYRRACQR